MSEVVEQIRRKCSYVERAHGHGVLGSAHLKAIDSTLLNLRRIEGSLSPETMEELISSLSDLRAFVRQSVSLEERRADAFTVPRIRSGEVFHTDAARKHAVTLVSFKRGVMLFINLASRFHVPHSQIFPNE